MRNSGSIPPEVLPDSNIHKQGPRRLTTPGRTCNLRRDLPQRRLRGKLPPGSLKSWPFRVQIGRRRRSGNELRSGLLSACPEQDKTREASQQKQNEDRDAHNN